MAEWLRMGGYAAYIWSSFGCAAAVVIWNLWTPRQRRREILKQLSEE